MRKKLLYTLLAALAFCSATAQSENFEKKMYLGLNFGYGFSGAMFQPNLKQQTYPSAYCGGISFKQQGEKNFGFQGEVNYLHRGYRIQNDSLSYQRTNNSLMVPAMMQVNIAYKRLNFILNLGTYASYMLNSKEKTTKNSITTENDYEIHLARDRRYEFGVLGGGGFYVDLNPILIQIEARYYYGLTNLLNPKYTNNRPLDSRQYQLLISGGLFFDLGSIFVREPKVTKK